MGDFIQDKQIVGQMLEDYISNFEKFKNMSIEVLIKSDALLNHATNVMEAIDTAITELDDAEKTHLKLKKLGQKHKTLHVPEDVIKVSFCSLYKL